MIHRMAAMQAPNETSYRQDLAAKMAEYQRDKLSGCDEPRHNLMDAVSRALELEGDRMGQLLGGVSLFLDRFFGPQPESCHDTGVPAPQPSGIIHEVERHLSRNDYLLGELEQKLRRLGDIA